MENNNAQDKNTSADALNSKSTLKDLAENYLFTLFLALLSSIGIAYFVIQVGQYVFMQDLSALA